MFTGILQSVGCHLDPYVPKVFKKLQSVQKNGVGAYWVPCKYTVRVMNITKDVHSGGLMSLTLLSDL